MIPPITKVAGHWLYLYRAVDHRAQIIDGLVSKRRDSVAWVWLELRRTDKRRGLPAVDCSADMLE